MRTPFLLHSVVGITAAAFLMSCSGSGSPVFTSGSLLPNGKVQRATTVSGDLIYVTTTKKVVILSYPAGKIVATLPWYFPGTNICSDPRNGNVFIPEGANIYEYAHGGTTPITMLTVPSGYSEPAGCAVDPSTGNLAVAIAFGPSDKGALLVYVGAQGTPLVYSDKQLRVFDYPAYDGSGNVYVTIDTVKGAFRIAEIRASQSRFRLIKVVNYDTGPRKIVWDGNYLTFLGSESDGSTVEQLQISGKIGTVVGSVSLVGGSPDGYFWIEGAPFSARLRRSGGLITRRSRHGLIRTAGIQRAFFTD